MPWIVQFYIHTMRIRVNGTLDGRVTLYTPSPNFKLKYLADTLLSNTSYVPPVPHAKPATFQTVLTLPPHSIVQLTLDVTKAFLRYTEHPPDAQRGWDLPPAVLIPIDSDGHFGKRIYTPPLLVDLATPDFSMPYNVIIFSCSLIAFVFGTIFNLMTRKFVVVPFGGEEKVKTD